MELKVIDLSGPTVSYKIAGKVSGSAALLQRVIVELLSDYSSILGRGCQLKEVTSTSFLGDEDQIKSDIQLAIATAKSNILAAQDSSTNLKPSETLVDLKPRKVFLNSSNQWVIELTVSARDGTTIGSSIVV